MTRLKLVTSDVMDDWYTIEKAEHENREEWIATGPSSVSLFCSCRISDACVEGTADEMCSIARAIRARESFSAKRCAVQYLPGSGSFEFWSPRNSQRPGAADAESADDLAEQIEAMLGESDTP